MTLTSFARHLFETGTAIAEPCLVQTENSVELEHIVKRAHLVARAEAAFESPDLDLGTAVWSLNVLAWGCNVFVERTEVKTELPTFLADREPKGQSPSEHWSADLGFRFFYSLIVRCQRIGPYDSLLQQLLSIGHRWPLATVGLHAEVNEQQLQMLLSDNCLRSLLVDRVVERNDESLAAHPLLEPHIAQAVGSHPNFKSWSASRGKL
jgi:hypothetical protein